jgi:hypothetical protein
MRLERFAEVVGVSVCVCFLAGCGGSDDGSAGAQPETAWQTLLTGEWTLAAGTERYVCARKTVTEDLIASGFEAINPPGTHHTLLTIGDPSGPDGVSDCNAAENHPLSVFGSGVGTNLLSFPDGVAVKIEAGQQLLLNLHLFNFGKQDITGTSGTRIELMQEADVQSFAEGVLAGTTELDIPPNEEVTSIGHCAMSHDVTVFAVAPHMHQLGVYMKVVAERDGESELVIHDSPYDFDAQLYYPIEPLPLAAGERVRVECTHRNTTTAPVTFGDSSFAEMCFAGIYRYPANGSPFYCLPPGP